MARPRTMTSMKCLQVLARDAPHREIARKLGTTTAWVSSISVVTRAFGLTYPLHAHAAPTAVCLTELRERLETRCGAQDLAAVLAVSEAYARRAIHVTEMMGLAP